jgi:hypothetical protein
MNRFPTMAALATLGLALAFGATPAQAQPGPPCYTTPAVTYYAPPTPAQQPYLGNSYGFYGARSYAPPAYYPAYAYPAYYPPAPALPPSATPPRYYNPGPYYYTPAYSYTPGYYSFYYTPGYFRY